MSSVYVCSDYSLLGNGIKNWKYVGSDLSGKAIIELLRTTLAMYRDIFEEVESVAYPPIGINRYIER